MTISAKVILDSISPEDIRLITLQLRYPKFIHGEFMTHRVFSRNASSSRAIPVERLIQDVLEEPAMPVFWGKNRPGMQAVEEMSEAERFTAIGNWLEARDSAVDHARRMARFGLHKQLVNRIIEPWCHINVIITSTDWANFFALRRHKDAQPEMKALADAAFEAVFESIPNKLKPGEWHLPYTDYNQQLGLTKLTQQDFIKASVARCARVSYLTHEGKKPSIEEDLKLYERLVGSSPLHASPAEHQATPDFEVTPEAAGDRNYDWLRWKYPEQHGNLRGWRQYRKMLPKECVRD